MDLETVKTMYVRGMQYAMDNYSSLFFDKQTALCKAQMDMVSRATTLQEVMNVIWVGNRTWESAFNAPSAICSGCELQYTGVQYGVGHIGWYFLYGIAGNISFNLSFFRLEIAPPAVVQQFGIDKSDAVRWILLGGFGETGSLSLAGSKDWHEIPPEWIYLKYDSPSDDQFTLQTVNNTDAVNNTQNVSVVLSTTTPMEFNVNLSYKDTTGVPHTLNVLMKALNPPSANMKGACACAANLGSLYYSYTNMAIQASADGSEVKSGNGWIDHQLMKTGLAKGWYVQALQTLSGLISQATGNKPVTDGWLWYAIQDYESNTQYMLTHFFGNKFYQDEIHLGDSLSMQLVNVYKDGVPYFKPNGDTINGKSVYASNLKVTVAEMVPSPISPNINLPSKYNITLPCGKNVILRIATVPNVYPVAYAPYETPAFLYAASSDFIQGKQIGIGLIEANHYFTNVDVSQRMISQIGSLADNMNLLPLILDNLQSPQSGWQKFLGFFLGLIPLWLIIITLYYIFHTSEKRGERTLHAAVALIALVILIKLGM